MKPVTIIKMGLTITLLLNTVVIMAQTKGMIFFEGSFKAAMAKAKQEKKYLFLDAYTSWCGPCKTMEHEVFTDPAVAEFFNANFICIRIDMEKGEGCTLSEKLRSVNGYPSLLFFSPQGYLFKTVLGSREPKVFLEEAKLAMID